MAARVLLVLSIVLAVTLAQFCDTPAKFPDYNVSSCDCSGLELQKISPYQRLCKQLCVYFLTLPDHEFELCY